MNLCAQEAAALSGDQNGADPHNDPRAEISFAVSHQQA
jgi:hypothetical protein